MSFGTRIWQALKKKRRRWRNPFSRTKSLIWNNPEGFSPAFLARHRDLVLYNAFHHVKAFLLFPWRCPCGNLCQCAERRTKVALSLDTDLYNKSLQEGKDPARSQAIRLLCKIPNDHYFRESQGEAYPVWWIEQELAEREKNNHFKIAGRLVWTLLRLGKTYEAAPFQKASLTEAITVLLGKTPLKRKTLEKQGYLGGGKAYRARFHEYKSVAQIKENQRLSLCDYSKGIYYAKLIREKTMTIAKLAESIGCLKAKLQNFLAFERVPKEIWDAIGNVSMVSSRTAAIIYSLSQKGEKYIAALIDLADQIRKGAGSSTLEKKVLKAVRDSDSIADQENITLPSGQVVAKWTKNGIQFAKGIPINPKEIQNALDAFSQSEIILLVTRA